MHRRFVVLTIAGLTVAPRLLAQPADPYPAACEPSTVSRSEAARAHTVFLSGKQYLDESSYDKAIQYFRDAYAIDCTVHGILRAIASAYERKGDKIAAVEALELYLRRAPTAADRDVVERRIKNLREQIDREGPQPTPAGPSPPAPPPEPAPTIEPPTVAPPPMAKPAQAPSLAPWIVGAVGGGTAVVGGVLAILGATDVSNASSKCSARVHCAADVADQGNRGRTLEQAAAVVLPSGVAVLATGILWRLLEGSPKDEKVPPAALVVGPHGYTGIAVDVTF
jgi:tetratricopeptide (TPR) repeat protein